MEDKAMKRRTIDIAFSVGGALFSVLLLILGLVLKDQADFAETYVHDQLAEQQIKFTARAARHRRRAPRRPAEEAR